jgi:hypothetical protein
VADYSAEEEVDEDDEFKPSPRRIAHPRAAGPRDKTNFRLRWDRGFESGSGESSANLTSSIIASQPDIRHAVGAARRPAPRSSLTTSVTLTLPRWTFFPKSNPFSLVLRRKAYLQTKLQIERPLAFISHDSRDKTEIAAPIALGLLWAHIFGEQKLENTTIDCSGLCRPHHGTFVDRPR